MFVMRNFGVGDLEDGGVKDKLLDIVTCGRRTSIIAITVSWNVGGTYSMECAAVDMIRGVNLEGARSGIEPPGQLISTFSSYNNHSGLYTFIDSPVVL